MTFTTLDELREARDKALLESDFLLLEDSPIREDLREVTIAEIKLYRQALRDLPARYEDFDPTEPVEWPTKPRFLT